MALLPFQYPFTMVVSGATGTGKTHVVLKIIDNLRDMVEPTSKRVV